MLRRWRLVPRLASLLALSFALALVHFAVEDAIHSVHHLLAAPEEAAACPIAMASSHLAGTAIDSSGAEPPLLPLLELAADFQPSQPTLQFFSPNQGRAPPQVA